MSQHVHIAIGVLAREIRKVFKKGILVNPHVYKQVKNDSGEKLTPEDR